MFPSLGTHALSARVRPGLRGHRYHGVTMRASSIEQAPCVKVLADKCTEKFGKDWNVGVDVVAYRDGYDSCGWHADDTQGETLIVAVILQSGGGPRRVQFRPKTPDAKYDDSNGITRREQGPCWGTTAAGRRRRDRAVD